MRKLLASAALFFMLITAGCSYLVPELPEKHYSLEQMNTLRADITKLGSNDDLSLFRDDPNYQLAAATKNRKTGISTLTFRHCVDCQDGIVGSGTVDIKLKLAPGTLNIHGATVALHDRHDVAHDILEIFPTKEDYIPAGEDTTPARITAWVKTFEVDGKWQLNEVRCPKGHECGKLLSVNI